MSRCRCGTLGCLCSDPDCASGWVPVADDPASVRPCRICRPGWRPPEERRQAAEQAAVAEAEGKRKAAELAVQLDEERQAAMFGDEDQPRHPMLGRDGG